MDSDNVVGISAKKKITNFFLVNFNECYSNEEYPVFLFSYMSEKMSLTVMWTIPPPLLDPSYRSNKMVETEVTGV